jgi:transcriptional regulator with XRE-family HTH domain
MTTQRYERIPEWTQGDRLRKARELTDMGQREFAEHIGVSHQTITNAEKGHRTVRKITLNAWSLATGVSVEWLECGIAPEDGPDGGQPSQPYVALAAA